VTQTCVSFDLETTGLDPDSDRIIEIGAVKFHGRKTLDSFHTLVNPVRRLPDRVRLLTGITNQELEAAPPLSDVVEGLVSFIGDCPIVGHSVGFDLGFLSSAGFTFSNVVYDTYELANIVRPQLDDYSLSALARSLQVPCVVHHRALDDAVTAKDVFLALLEELENLDLPLIAEANRLTMGSDWPWRPLFLDVESSKVGSVSLWDKAGWEAEFTPVEAELVQRKPLVAEAVAKPLDLDWLSALLGEGGPMSKAFPAFECRPGQVSMLREVARAFNDGQQLVVEAGTGIGKSIAYLLPAVFFARQNNMPVVISTNTINLQEQLTNKDIPELLQALDSRKEYRPGPNLEVAQLKGRSNYLCLRRWSSWRKIPGLPWEETRFLLRVLFWLAGTFTGDRSELNLVGNEIHLWARLCASEDNCVTGRCPHYPDGCFLYRARHKAVGAHVIVVNHALLLSDLAKSGGILPEYRHLIIDEAHHVEAEATEQLGYRIAAQDLYGCLEHFGDRGGFLVHLRSYLRTGSVGRSGRREIEEKVDDLLERAKVARTGTGQLFEMLTRLLGLQLGQQVEYERNLRLSGEVRRRGLWSDVQSSWEALNMELAGIETGLGEVCTMTEALPGRRSPDLNDCLAEMSSLWQQISGLRSRMESVIANPEDGTIYWAELTRQGEMCLHAAPLQVGQLLDRMLFSQKDCAVLTSATLSTGGNFQYVKSSLGLEEADELMTGAPFDYEKSTLILLAEDIAEPGKGDYQRGVEQSVVELCRATHGRILVLFTSHAALRTTYGAVQPPLEAENILVLGQGVDGSPRRVLNTFKANPDSLLLGARALWEGVDVVGEGLSVLVIVRLPFAVPSDPVISARSGLFHDPFNEYLVPQAVLRFKQGFGRLIRSRTDRGVVVILDKRLKTKTYGEVFLQSLPKCTIRTRKLRQMPQEVLSWLGG
jgi:ATP-dependent DNA helicase DinG